MRFRAKGLVRVIAIVASATLLLCAMPITSYASSNVDMKKRVVGVAGIMSSNIVLNDPVTRSQFAGMLAKASKYRDILTNKSNVSIFTDVPATSENASAIRLCAEKDWMSAFLGGKFRPDQAVTLAEAEKGLLGLLGYTSEDFSGDQYNMRHAKAASLDILENVTRAGSDPLNGQDCVNLFYNLLRCKNTENSAYVTVLGGTLSSDGEVNANSFAQDGSLKGPKFFKGSTGLQRFNSWLPFAANDGTTYVNGDPTTYETLKTLIQNSGAVCYYNSTAKVVWAYSCDGTIINGKGAMRGKITAIHYNSADTLTPSGVEISGDDGTREYKITSSDMQFAFGIYGSCKVGETVTVIYTATENDTSGYDGTVVDYIYGD